MEIKNGPTNAFSPAIPLQHCSQSRNTIAALHAIMQSPLELQKHIVKHTSSPPLQHCTQSCNTNAALHAIMQYQCGIARNHAIPMQHCTQSCNPSATNPALPVQQCMHHRGKTTTYYYNEVNCFEAFSSASSSSSLSLLTFPCVSILKTQWLSSPHNLVQHGESHGTLQ